MSNSNPVSDNPYALGKDETTPQEPQGASQGTNATPQGQSSTEAPQVAQNSVQGAYGIPPSYPTTPPSYSTTPPPYSANTATGDRVDMTVSYAWMFFFGGLGAHKFYMGNHKAGFIYLSVTILSVLLSIIGIGFVLSIAMLVLLYADIRTMPDQVDEANANGVSGTFVWLNKAFSGEASKNRKP